MRETGHYQRDPAAKAVSILEEVGVLVETTGRQRDRVFSCSGYLGLLKVETEPL